jgi:hypothetical protein
MTSSGSSEQKKNRRSCLLLAIAALIILLALLAVGFGWVGRIETHKNSAIPVLGDNRT